MLDARQTVNFVKIDRIDTRFENRDLFEYRPDRGWRWLQKAAIAVLRWCGAYHESVVTTFTRSPQENDDLLKSLVGQQGQWIELIASGKQPEIFMGPDEHADLMRLSNHMGMQPVRLSGRIKVHRSRHDWEWHGIPITVVPWMQGAIIVPR